MEENILLAAFVILPISIFWLLKRYFWRASTCTTKAQWPRLIIANILFFIFLCSLVLLCGEVYCRFLCDTTDSFGLTKVTSAFFDRHYQPNHNDYRDSVDYSLELSGKQRITFIGDSFTVGHGIADVEDRFVNRIRTMRPDWEIHAIARNGWDTSQEIDNLEKLWQLGYEFDQAVLVYVLNDVSDIIPQWRDILNRIYSKEPGFLFKHSYFLNVLYYRHFAAGDPAISDYFSFVRDAYDGPLWEKHKERLTYLKNEMDKRNIDFYVVTFPFMQVLGPNYMYRDIHERLGTFWDSLGVPHLDLLPTYEPYPAKEMVVNAHDAHPNKQAHALAANAINEFLKKNIESSK